MDLAQNAIGGSNFLVSFPSVNDFVMRYWFPLLAAFLHDHVYDNTVCGLPFVAKLICSFISCNQKIRFVRDLPIRSERFLVVDRRR